MKKREPETQPETRVRLFRGVFSVVLILLVLLASVFFSSLAVRRNQPVRPVVAPTTTTETTIESTTAAPTTKKPKPKTTKATTTETTKPVPTSKVIYLTFDDGPWTDTERLLDILDKYNVKVTFFVTHVAPKYQYLIKREAKSGHSVGVHSYSHNYEKIYASEEAFWEDFRQMRAIIKEETGVNTKLMRFPGGSSNTVSKKKSPGIMTRLTKEMTRKGIAYFDWNCMSGDAGLTTQRDVVLQNCKKAAMNNAQALLLCHDSKTYTVDAMEEFIKWALDNGYTFLPLKEDSFTVHHTVLN